MTHFHSILVEYAFGLGLLAIVPLVWFRRPKEVLFWSLVLGIADAHIRRRQR